MTHRNKSSSEFSVILKLLRGTGSKRLRTTGLQPWATLGLLSTSTHPIPSLHALIHCIYQKSLKNKSLQENDNWYCYVSINSILTTHLCRARHRWEVTSTEGVSNPRKQLVAELGYEPIILAWKLMVLTIPLWQPSITMNSYGNTYAWFITFLLHPILVAPISCYWAHCPSFLVNMRTQPVITCQMLWPFISWPFTSDTKLCSSYSRARKIFSVKDQIVRILDLCFLWGKSQGSKGGRNNLTCFEGNLCSTSSDKFYVPKMQYTSKQPQNFPNFFLAKLHYLHCHLEENI